MVRIYARTLRLLWQAAPGGTTWLIGLMLIQGLIPPLSIWLLKVIVDHVVAGVFNSWLVGAWALVLLSGQLALQVATIVQTSLNERWTATVELLVLRKAVAIPDLAPFEDAAWTEQLQNLTRLAAYRPLNLMTTTVQLVPQAIASVGLLLLLAGVAWWLPPLLIVATLPLGWADLHLQQQSWKTTLAGGTQTKLLRYLVQLGTSAEYAKEMRVYGAGPFLEQRYTTSFEQLHAQSRHQRRRHLLLPISATVGFVIVNTVAFGWVLFTTAQGTAAAGAVVLVLQGLLSLQRQLGGLAGSVSLARGHLLFFEDLFAFVEQPLSTSSGSLALSLPLQQGICFEHVSYHYPDGTVALEQVSFTLKPGQCVALVGENGAGKSTLIKLLCRLYQPTTGRITVDGVDLQQLDLQAWRSCLGAVFQDFGRYQLSVADNLTLGQQQDDQQKLRRALEQVGLTDRLDQLEAGLAAQLGPQFGGADLSGGQWQRLGIARALLREAAVLIFDEPTAALDPRAEAALFAQFATLAAGRTSLLVTHRLASVRMADYVLVLHQGRLIEAGTHAELLQQQGEYASLWHTQAAQYMQS